MKKNILIFVALTATISFATFKYSAHKEKIAAERAAERAANLAKVLKAIKAESGLEEMEIIFE